MFRLKSGKEAKYRAAHASVWPELIAAERQAGLRNHSVYVLGDVAFAYGEADDLKATMDRLAADPVNLRWNEAMAELMEDVDGTLIEEVFHFD